MRILLRINSGICILSPWLYMLARFLGLVNHPKDVYIFLFLLIVMGFASFMEWNGE